MATYRLWPSTNGPSTATNFNGNFISGMLFFVTGEAWFQGYQWWVCNSGGQPTTATKFALWQVDTGGTPHLVPGSVVTSGTLTAGQWNYVPLATPIPLALGGSTGTSHPSGGHGGALYVAAVGVNGSFPDTNNYWGASPDPGSAGITNGPLTAYSATSGTMPQPWALAGVSTQGVYSTGGSDPSTTCPESSSGTDNFWIDVQVSDYSGAPANTSLRLWPGLPYPATAPNLDTGAAVSATAFTLSQPCKLNKIWMFSPPTATGFATRVGIWNTNTQTEVSGTDNSSPSWKDPGGGSATAGDGWIYVDYSAANVTLPAGNYAVAFFNGNAAKIYFDTPNYFFSGTNPINSGSVAGPGWNGVSWGGGVLVAPNVAAGPQLVYDNGSGTAAGQTMYTGPTAHTATTTWVYPIGFEATADYGETRWADVEVTPAAATGSGALPAATFP